MSGQPTPSRARALLASLRIPNAPSVLSNAWFGYMLGCFYLGDRTGASTELPLVIIAGLCLYFAGNLANDWFDRKWDATHRPERALPAGLFQPIYYLLTAAILAASGLAAAASVNLPTLGSGVAILVLIGIYTWLHKRTRWAVLPMGLCRAGLYLMGACAAMPDVWLEEAVNSLRGSSTATSGMVFTPVDALRLLWFFTTHALGVLIYIAGLSLAARYESTEHPPHGMVLLSRAMLLLPLAAMSCWWMSWYPLPTLVGLVPFAIWLSLSLTRFRSPVPKFVSALLAGIPLIDFISCVPLAISLAAPDLRFVEQPLLVATVTIPLVAFALGRLLQRVAPAT
ncbi:UbiA family prenyltransferase [Haloferula rosea]|uniref:UbiA family prenyltransferase n=1 Tax=Haloferula rosea TaxID=490093 RepID=A0A934VEQ7_9BACT|nr:UbiA family prenyltransferase [Haloferula rosea]MBK1825785.1 UbiA family prenyltransferase [Haloferula rosea]